jgi:rod shape-determining protein MreC
MDSFFVRFKNPLVLISIMVVQVVALALQVPRASGDLPGSHADGHKVSLLRYWASAAVTPFERVTHGSGLGVRHLWSNYIDLRHTREQNLALQQEIVRLRQEQEGFAEDAAQGRRLQALLGFQQQYISATVAAQVIGTSGTDRSSMISIDKGYKDGLKSDQAVMTPDGVIGKVRDVWAHTAQVLLLNDATSGAGVVLSSSRIRGIVRGTAYGQLLIDNLTSDSRIKVGDQVVTSGGDKVFPRGLPVGEITSIVPDPQHQPYTAITVKPYANLSRLDEVLVVTGTDSTLPPTAQKDAAQAEAAEQESKRAADLVAQKLPSLPQNSTDPSNPAASTDNSVGGVTGIPNSGLPRPKPPLHPDSYSPGAAPPASDLKPGAPSPNSPPPKP